ncbi:methyltransferase domain-containing protein [Clostridium pasteurianum]|uniref:methyltransferase domain-containing protein n=1 Tax=Clostridium pasteurianum TaxID=1501 RepID=UPI002260CE1F|nr:methyltransferase domain-containing protein [Clostridium pasteurianum]UZW15442.1 methyltransferase domain-containing protein [Clostridium pasteurianum]
MKYLKNKKYDTEFMRENMMGPNSMKILEELMNEVILKSDMRVLDLGCGKGLTSIFLANEFGVQVFAADLWISATDNYNRFKKMKLENSIIPIHADATQLPFADEYFDAVISVDAYHYFGSNNQYFDSYLAPLIKKGGTIAIGIPGMRNEIIGEVPKEMKPYWAEEALATWHSCNWWKNIFEQSENIDICSIKEMIGFEEPWNNWLACENEFAIGDRAMLKADGGRYMNLISIIGKKK